MKGSRPCRLTKYILLCLLLTLTTVLGCGKGTTAKVLYGNVTCGGEKVPKGKVLFVPIENTPGPTSTAIIVDGQYRVEARGGVPLGKHRVQVDARKNTGRTIKGHNGREITMIDEEVRMGPEVYSGNHSPLTIDLCVDFDDRYDIAIPAK